jgi:serine/threonine protein kinase
MGKAEVKREAVARQGTTIRSTEGRRFTIMGTQKSAVFEFGGEGLVHRAVDVDRNVNCRIKCFFEPDQLRYQRSSLLVQSRLADLGRSVADALGGAPYEMLQGLGPYTPFAIVMKNVAGTSWRNLKERAQQETYPPPGWPEREVRATWAYGLATAVMNMERRDFIHADLSDGNVMVSPSGPRAGDMALVDFDSFVHPSHPELDSSCRGSDGYAAPEIWRSQGVGRGSDRLGLAILIQEFLVIGAPELNGSEAFGWRYDQDAEICSLKGEPHPFFSERYPELADLVRRALRAQRPELRPDGEAWRPALRALAAGVASRRRLSGITLTAHPLPDPNFQLPFHDAQKALDLSSTAYRIRATLQRNSDLSVDLIVHDGAEIRVGSHAGRSWRIHASGDRVQVVPGTVLFDDRGKVSARIDGKEV